MASKVKIKNKELTWWTHGDYCYSFQGVVNAKTNPKTVLYYNPYSSVNLNRAPLHPEGLFPSDTVTEADLCQITRPAVADKTSVQEYYGFTLTGASVSAFRNKYVFNKAFKDSVSIVIYGRADYYDEGVRVPLGNYVKLYDASLEDFINLKVEWRNDLTGFLLRYGTGTNEYGAEIECTWHSNIHSNHTDSYVSGRVVEMEDITTKLAVTFLRDYDDHLIVHIDSIGDYGTNFWVARSKQPFDWHEYNFSKFAFEVMQVQTNANTTAIITNTVNSVRAVEVFNKERV